MALSEAEDILKRHVLERKLRTSIRSLVLDGELAQIPRMSQAQWIDSCQLTRGVPELTLQLLEAWLFESKGSTWTVNAVRIQGKLKNIPIEQIAVRLTLSEAAAALGQTLTYRQCQTLLREAMSVVLDNLVERARNEGAA
jgi:hypothetical protein